MPPAKKPAASRRRTALAKPPSPTARNEVEEAAARFDAALDQATKLLQSMRRDLGKNARTAYKDVAAALKKVRSDARTTNSMLIRDLERLRTTLARAAAVSDDGAASGRSRRSTSRSSGGGRATAAKRATTTKSAATRKTASAKPATKRASTRNASKPATRSRAARGRGSGTSSS